MKQTGFQIGVGARAGCSPQQQRTRAATQAVNETVAGSLSLGVVHASNEKHLRQKKLHPSILRQLSAQKNGRMNGNQHSGEAGPAVMETSAELCPRSPEIWISAFSGGSPTGKAQTRAGRVLKYD